MTGLVNIDMTPEFAARFGAAYGSTLPKGASVVVNRDYHRSPRMIKRAIISGLPSAGINALDIKSHADPGRPVRHPAQRKAVGGVHVRLSPFDSRVVDIKLFDETGLDIDRKTERKIENLYFREDVRRVYLDEIGLIDGAAAACGRLLVRLRQGAGRRIRRRREPSRSSSTTPTHRRRRRCQPILSRSAGEWSL